MSGGKTSVKWVAGSVLIIPPAHAEPAGRIVIDLTDDIEVHVDGLELGRIVYVEAMTTAGALGPRTADRLRSLLGERFTERVLDTNGRDSDVDEPIDEAPWIGDLAAAVLADNGLGELWHAEVAMVLAERGPLFQRAARQHADASLDALEALAHTVQGEAALRELARSVIAIADRDVSNDLVDLARRPYANLTLSSPDESRSQPPDLEFDDDLFDTTLSFRGDEPDIDDDDLFDATLGFPGGINGPPGPAWQRVADVDDPTHLVADAMYGLSTNHVDVRVFVKAAPLTATVKCWARISSNGRALDEALVVFPPGSNEGHALIHRPAVDNYSVHVTTDLHRSVRTPAELAARAARGFGADAAAHVRQALATGATTMWRRAAIAWKECAEHWALAGRTEEAELAETLHHLSRAPENWSDQFKLGPTSIVAGLRPRIQEDASSNRGGGGRSDEGAVSASPAQALHQFRAELEGVPDAHTLELGGRLFRYYKTVAAAGEERKKILLGSILLGFTLDSPDLERMGELLDALAAER